MKTKKGNSTKRKSNIEILAAQYGLYGVIIAATIGACGVVVAAFFGYLGIRAQSNASINATQTSEYMLAPSPTLIASISGIPTAGAQLDFSPQLNPGEKLDDIPKMYGMLSSPFSGLYLWGLSIPTTEDPTSWRVHYLDGTVAPAESEVCLINLGYGESLQSPLNMKASDIMLVVSVFVDSRYSMTLTDVEILLTNYVQPRTDIDFVEVRFPGAGGFGGEPPFPEVRTESAVVDKVDIESYGIDFQDFTLKPYEGVKLLMPIFLLRDGIYQFQVKVNGIAVPTYDGDPQGDITLTSGRASYEWAQIHDPRQYRIQPDEMFPPEDPSGQVNLIPCP